MDKVLNFGLRGQNKHFYYALKHFCLLLDFKISVALLSHNLVFSEMVPCTNSL